MVKDGVTNLQIMVDAEHFLWSFYICTAVILEKGNKSSIELEISHVSNSENGLLTRGITINPNDD